MINNIDKFNMIASTYDQDIRINDSIIILNEIKKRLCDTSNKKLLDYGCGSGLIGLNLTNDFEEVILLDPAKNMIEVVENKIIENNILNAKTSIIDIDIKNIDFRVDYIVIVQTLLHIDNYLDVLKMLSNCLNDKGHLIIVDFDKNNNIKSKDVHNGFNQEELLIKLNEYGLKKEYQNTFYFREKMFMNTDASLFIIDVIK